MSALTVGRAAPTASDSARSHGSRRRAAVAASCVLGAAALGAGIGLLATAAWLISRAAQHPHETGARGRRSSRVQFFGLSQGLFRYGSAWSGTTPRCARWRICGCGSTSASSCSRRPGCRRSAAATCWPGSSATSTRCRTCWCG